MATSLTMGALKRISVFGDAFETDESKDISIEVFFASPLQHLVLCWDPTTRLVRDFLALWTFHGVTVNADGTFANCTGPCVVLL